MPGSPCAVASIRRRFAGSLGDPARELAAVLGAECGLELLDPAPVLAEGGNDRLAIVEEDVDPDARIGARDPRHVAQRAARRLEGVVAVDARRAGLVEQHVGEGVRHVTRDRDEPVVGARIDRDGPRPERGDEAVHRAQQLRPGARGRRQEPGRTLEELRIRTLWAARLGAADRMAADEAAVSSGGGADRALRRADVGDDAPARREREHLSDDVGQLRHGSGDEDEVGALHGGFERGDGLDRLLLAGDAEHVRIGIPAADGGSAAPCGKRGGRADQSRPDDGDVPEHVRA